MIEQQARVVAVDTVIRLETRRKSSCEGCAARRGCGHGLLDAAGSSRSVYFELPRDAAPADVAVGDELVLGLPEDAVLRASMRVYLLPLLGMLGGTLLGGLVLSSGDLGAVIGALAGLASGIMTGRLQDARASEPIVLRTCASASDGSAEPYPISVV